MWDPFCLRKSNANAFYEFMIIQNHGNLSTIPKDNVPITFVDRSSLSSKIPISLVSLWLWKPRNTFMLLSLCHFLELILPSWKIVFDVRKIQQNRIFSTYIGNQVSNLRSNFSAKLIVFFLSSKKIDRRCEPDIKRILESRIWRLGGIFYSFCWPSFLDIY